jgi:hypothetical protein
MTQNAPSLPEPAPLSPAHAAAVAAVPVGPPGEEIQAVQQTLERMTKVQNPQELAEFLTDESAGVMGFILLIPVGLAASMTDMVPSGSGPAADKNLKPDMEALLKKYGLDTATGMQDAGAAQTRLKGKGRAFLKDMAGLLVRLQKSDAAQSQKMGFQPTKDLRLEKLTFTVISPTEVKISPKSGTQGAQNRPKDQTILARVEEGKWRIDLMPMMKTQGTLPPGSLPTSGAPGMPGGFPPMGAPPALPR